MKDVVACEMLRGAGKQALIRRCPNGETDCFGSIATEYIGCKANPGIETSQYPEEEKSTEIPLVVASERGTAQLEPVDRA